MILMVAGGIILAVIVLANLRTFLILGTWMAGLMGLALLALWVMGS